MSKTNRLKEILDKATPLREIPAHKRDMAQSVAVHTADNLIKLMEESPDLAWTFALNSGVQLYVTKPSGKSYGPEVGEILVLNQCTSFGHMVGCNNADGLGTSADRDKIRLATPADSGYKSTREEWHAILRAENASLNRSSFIAWSVAIVFLGALLLKSV